MLRRSVERVLGAHLQIIAPAGNTASFEEMSQRWQAVGKTVSDLTCPKIYAQTSTPEMNALGLDQPACYENITTIAFCNVE